jgi:hypothetical protein
LKPTLCTDVDSTIWNTGAWVCSAVLDITGETLERVMNSIRNGLGMRETEIVK